MKRLKIGYVPISPSLTAPGDRRRIVYWAKDRGHILTTDLNENVDILVASENSDFTSSYFSQRRVPLVFDLVDAYIAPIGNIEDYARGYAKRIAGPISKGFLPFSKHVMNFCRDSDAVVCSSIEQVQTILPFNKNVLDILDFHEEIPFKPLVDKNKFLQKDKRIIWEGQPATLGGLRQIDDICNNICNCHQVYFDFVTDQKYFKFLNRYVVADTRELIAKYLHTNPKYTNVLPWSLNNLSIVADVASIGVIPIDLMHPLIRLKPENRLLIMWRLGLPCLTSNSPAYKRVEQDSGVKITCDTTEDWSVAIESIFHDADLAYEHVIAGQQYLRENHNRDIILTKWDSVIESLL